MIIKNETYTYRCWVWHLRYGVILVLHPTLIAGVVLGRLKPRRVLKDLRQYLVVLQLDLDEVSSGLVVRVQAVVVYAFVVTVLEDLVFVARTKKNQFKTHPHYLKYLHIFFVECTSGLKFSRNCSWSGLLKLEADSLFVEVWRGCFCYYSCGVLLFEFIKRNRLLSLSLFFNMGVNKKTFSTNNKRTLRKNREDNNAFKIPNPLRISPYFSTWKNY